MRSRISIYIAAILLILVGVVYFSSREGKPVAESDKAAVASATSTHQASAASATSPGLITTQKTAESPTNHLAYRLKNTTKTSGQLLQDDHAVLLENALIDTSKPRDFKLPDSLKLSGDPGSYIVQARGVLDDAFRAVLESSGAKIISYIPNNAYLVRASAAAARQLEGQGIVQAVLPYEPVYKPKGELLGLAMRGEPLPKAAKLNVLVFSDARSEVVAELKRTQVTTLAEDSSPFGTVLTVQPGEDWVALTRMPGVQIIERAYRRMRANDISRVRMGVAEDSITSTNYLGLTGTNILVSINDSGVDALHPDLAGRVFSSVATSLVDSNGHGTHVAGIIAGSGLVSSNVIKLRGSSVPGTNIQFRGVAPGANLFVQNIGNVGSGFLLNVSDQTIQETVAATNALISNNSWVYAGNDSYSLAAASYDAAVRDSLSGISGSQPALYVFAAGNSGRGNDDGSGGSPGSVQSPGTSKNVLTVGAVESDRDIDSVVTKITASGTNASVLFTNTSRPWRGMTSSANEVAGFSSRGNVGIGIEGDFGRFKPDVVAPGTFVASTRSTNWDEIAYYNPTNHLYTTLRDQVMVTNALNDYSIFLPENTVGFTITLYGNNDSPVPLPNLPIYVKRDGTPTTTVFDLRRTNVVAVPPDLSGVGASVGQNWSYSIGNTTKEDISINILTEIITTNDLGDYYTVLSNLNNSISGTNLDGAKYYRFESGTSMAAAGASGTLALMQEFFTNTLSVRPSPALLKGLLINGARSAGNLYNFQVRNSINYQGWGLFKLNNSLPPDITNSFKITEPGSIKLFDQSPTNALATGQSKTRTFNVSDAGRTFPLRVTLAWTDPPGNPAAGVKLVNDLDLVITNNETGDVYFGNDIPAASRFSFPWDTNSPPNLDSVNNVENVYIDSTLGTNYSITVVARRVNVNAVTAHTNNVVQDYALIISSGNGEATNSLTLVSQTAILGTEPPQVIQVTNSFSTPTFASTTLINQRIGGNTPLLGTTNGITNQWKFYVLTNSTVFTNASFLVSQQTDLAVPRIGLFSEDSDEATRRYADVDLYVSQNPGLTNLDPAVVTASFKSRTRNELSGDEFVAFTDSTQGAIYYIGVKSEDQMAAQFEFWGIFSLLPLGAEDGEGYVQAYPMLGYEIPDGTPNLPGGTRFVAITRPSTTGFPETVRRVVLTNNVTHENYGDVVATLDHNSKVAVYDNHRSLETPPYPLPPGPYGFFYDDSGEVELVNTIPPDGPGTFQSYNGEAPGGTWYFTYSDDALSQTGRVNDIRLKVERQPDDDRAITNVIAPNSWRYFSRNIPVEATNLTICISNISASPQPLKLYIRKAGRPTDTVYDFSTTINPPGDCFEINKSSLPPLTAGRYFIAVYNANATSQTFVYQARVGLGLPPAPTLFSANGKSPLIDDAAMHYSQFVTNDSLIAQMEVGLRIDHPRVSDLAVTLVSPRGTRVLLVENRGGLDTNGFGSTLTATNFVPVAANGGAAGQTNLIDAGATVGSVTIDYEFFQVPDQMTVYYEGNLLANTRLTSGAGRLVLNYGPGASTIIEVRMNEFGNTNAITRWNYSISSFSESHSYLAFTDNTNKTTTPIKFAAPPFGGNFGSVSNISDFEPPVVAQDYVGPTTGTPDGWNVLPTNAVTVITNSAYPPGDQSLALRSGMIQRSLATVPGRTYRLGYAYRKASNIDGIVSWWPGQSNSTDIVGANHGILQGGATYGVGKVGAGFVFDGSGDVITLGNAPNLQLQNFSIEAWVRRSSALQTSLGSFGNGVIFGFGQNGYGLYLDLNGVPALSRIGVSETKPAVGITDTNFHHLAVTKTNATVLFYIDGVEYPSPVYDPGFTFATVAAIGARGDNLDNSFLGTIDEVSVYNRVISRAGIRDIYLAGAAGKCGMITPPAVAVCSPPLGAQIFVAGIATNTFLGTTNWQQGGLIFTATNTSTIVNLAPLNTNSPSGVWVDSFVLAENSGSRYVLPEESLKVLDGENSYGEWKLEILDTRTGATNNVSLIDWQLAFTFQTEGPLPTTLVSGTPKTRTIAPGQIDYYIIDVPAFSRFATNSLLALSGNLNLLFNQTIRPTGTNTVPSDYTLLAGNIPGSVTLTTNLPPLPPPAGPPLLLPGQRYYLGVQNPGAVPLTYTLQVDFDLATFPTVVDLLNGIPYCAFNPSPGVSLDYYRYTVSSNAARAQFEVNNLTGDMTLLLRRGLPPTFTVLDYFSANVFTNDEVITVLDFTQPVPLSPGDWYMAAANISGAPVSYCAKVSEWSAYGTNIVITNSFISSNSFCLSWTSLPGLHYFVEGVTNLTSTNWVAISPTLTATGYSATHCVSLPSPFKFFRVRQGIRLNPYFPPPVISEIRRLFTGVLIKWGGPVAAQYQVQWTSNVIPPITWRTFLLQPAVTSTTGLFQFLDDGTQTAGFGDTRYYRLMQLP